MEVRGRKAEKGGKKRSSLKSQKQPSVKKRGAGLSGWIRFLAVSAGIAWAVWFACHCIGLYQVRQAAEQKRLAHEKDNAELSNMKYGSDVLELYGKQYRRNTAMRAVLCLGVDTSGEMERYQVSGAAGQADTIILAAQDAAQDTVRLLMIPRDTMTDITLFDYFGNELGKDVQHLALAFAYGDGREQSCELMAEAVSDLLFGLKIDGYFTANLGTIAVFNDEIGGVEVVIDDSELAARDPAFQLGESIVLRGEQAERYIRYRDINQYQTALSRMERQKNYIRSYLDTAKRRYQEDDQVLVRLANDVEKYTITNLSKDQYMDMGLAILNSPQILREGDMITVPGTVQETELYEEFYPDKEALKEIVINLFYKEVR